MLAESFALSALCVAASAGVIRSPIPPRAATLPFSRMVVFGDDLSDNGNGTAAHYNTKIYNSNTWTNGAVTPSYLADLIQVPLAIDYAFGGTDGGANFGATIDNSFTESNSRPMAPSSKDQIANYTSGDIDARWKEQIGNTLHFLWIGRNDIMPWWFQFGASTSPGCDHDDFAGQFSDLLTAQVKSLLDQGAQHVVVPNLYPKQYSPWAYTYAGYDTADKQAVLGAYIQKANAAIQTSLASLSSSKILYFDAYALLDKVWRDGRDNNGATYGIKYTTKNGAANNGWFCDPQDWDVCFNKDFTEKEIP